MKIISEALFLISNGLMVPVMLSLLFLLGRGIWIMSGFYRKWNQHKRIRDDLGKIVKGYSSGESKHDLPDIQAFPDSIIKDCLSAIKLHQTDRALCEHELSDFQIKVHAALGRYRMLIKFGPMLGLMGTLIPMGPALVGLAVGDISSMANNMQLAFATTVVGMLVAGIGVASLQMEQGFYASALNDIEFITARLLSE